MDITSLTLLPYTVPVLVVVFMFIIQLLLLLFTGVGFDLDADHDVDLDADLDIHTGLHIDHDVDIDLDHDLDHFSLGRFLSPLGVGQVPLSIVGYTYSLSYGVAGIAGSFMLAQFFALSWWFLAITLPLSMLVGWHATKKVITLIIPLLKTSGTAACKKSVIGKTGKVTSTKVTNSFGEAALRVNNVVNHMIVLTEDNEPIHKGDEIIVTGFDETSQRPIVSKIKA